MLSVNGGVQVIVTFVVLRRIIPIFAGAARSPIIQKTVAYSKMTMISLHDVSMKCNHQNRE